MESRLATGTAAPVKVLTGGAETAEVVGWTGVGVVGGGAGGATADGVVAG